MIVEVRKRFLFHSSLNNIMNVSVECNQLKENAGPHSEKQPEIKYLLKSPSFRSFQNSRYAKLEQT